MQGNVLRFELAEVDARDDLAVHDQKKSVADKKFREIGILMLAGYDFVHREAHGFETLQLLNLTDHRGLIDVDHGALCVGPQETEQARAGDAPDNECDGECSEQDAGEDAGQKALSPCCGGRLRLNDGSHSYAHRLG